MAAIPTPAEFLVAFPEFTGAAETLIQSKLDQAVQRTDAEVWGELFTQGVLYRAADLLAKSPTGRAMKISDNGGKTLYWDDLQTMKKRVASGFRVT